jgi:Zn-finger nucleic acid-binding protein
LTEVQVGDLRVDVCQGGCGGIWFDAFELQRADDATEAVGERLLEVPRRAAAAPDPARKRECPRCEGVKLSRHFYSAKRRVEVDECPNCGGCWLDAGELAQIRAERKEAASAAQARESNISAEMIRYLYRLRSGEGESGRRSAEH